MQTYLVGGAVRDTLLDLPVKDRDWIVVGARPADLLNQGYQQVGADFPVFLHPTSKEEYALARTERKSGVGHTGFSVHFSQDVTLEEDLKRRDLTINAIAQAADGTIIDPFNGQADIENRQLRHVSEAFREDPLRVLRVARFAARFAHLGFTVADETLALMQQMVASGEVASLVAERVWSEMSRALVTQSPEVFFMVLRQAGALKVVFAELDQLFGVPQKMRWHPEVDTGIHTLKSLACARRVSDDLEVLMATLCHDLGKGQTAADLLPAHHQHELAGANIIKSIAKKYKWPTPVAKLCELVARYHTQVHNVFNLRPATVVKLLNSLDAFRQPARLPKFLTACAADSRGRSGYEHRAYRQADYLQDCLRECQAITAAEFVAQGIKGAAIGEAMYRARITRVAALKQSLTATPGDQ